MVSGSGGRDGSGSETGTSLGVCSSIHGNSLLDRRSLEDRECGILVVFGGQTSPGVLMRLLRGLVSSLGRGTEGDDGLREPGLRSGGGGGLSKHATRVVVVIGRDVGAKMDE